MSDDFTPAARPQAPPWTPEWQQKLATLGLDLRASGFEYAALVSIRSHETGEYGYAQAIGANHWTAVLDMGAHLVALALAVAREAGQGEAAALEALRLLAAGASSALRKRGGQTLPAPKGPTP